MSSVADYTTTALALQRHEANILRRYKAWEAEQLRAMADGYELRAEDPLDDVTDAKELIWIAFGLRIAAAKVDPA
jgi:hypothetical protein